MSYNLIEEVDEKVLDELILEMVVEAMEGDSELPGPILERLLG